jgi:DNA-binding PadR family transcriptional regulator
MATTVSTLGYALLALVAKKPSTAYELAQRTRRPLGYFWSAHYGQIHPQLRALDLAGLLTVEARPGPGPHDKRVYALTAAGRAALAAWVVEPPSRPAERDEFLLKVYAIWLADPVKAARLALDMAAHHRDRLAELVAIDLPDVPADHPDFGSVATLRYGIGYERHRAQWCEWLATALGADRQM